MGSPLRLSALLLAIACAGCAVNPVSGRTELAVISAEQERDLGRKEAERVVEEQGLIEDRALVAYVEALGQRLAARSPRHDVTYTFRVVDVPEPNAFALPGGHIFVTRGLLALFNSEDELAGVIAHEIGHVAARHSVQRVSRAAPMAILTGLGAVAAGIVSPNLGRAVGGLGRLGTEAVLAPFSRDQEREADRVGQDIVAAAGWDPSGLTTSLATLGRYDELTRGTARRASFLDTHPSTPERVENTRVHARQLSRAPHQPLSASPAAFVQRLDGVVVGPSAAEGTFERQRFLHPDLDIALRFPDGWKTFNHRDQVGAKEPAGHALIVVEAVGRGNDPLAGARALEKATGARVTQGARRLTIGELDAARSRARARTDSGEVVIELGWIAHGGRVFQLSGLTPTQRAQALAPIFTAVMESFRPLNAAERTGFREVRLRLVEPSAGESAEALAARTRTGWKPEMITVVNGLATGARLAPGQPIKVGMLEPYTPRSAP